VPAPWPTPHPPTHPNNACSCLRDTTLQHQNNSSRATVRHSHLECSAIHNSAHPTRHHMLCKVLHDHHAHLYVSVHMITIVHEQACRMHRKMSNTKQQQQPLSDSPTAL
jgi:hypothetical protein